MKLTSILPALAALLVLTGCDIPTPSLLSLEPLAAEQDSINTNNLLVGAWVPGSGEDVAVIRRNGEKGYKIFFIGGASPMAFDARLFKVGEARLMELKSDEDTTFNVAGHALARVWTEGGALRWAFLDSDWLKQQLGPLAAHTRDGKTVLLAPRSAIRALLDRYAADERACSKQATWQRLQ